MRRILLTLSLTCAAAWTATLTPAAADDAQPTVRISQDGSGDLRGDDEGPILQAIDRWKDSGGRISIGPGEYWIRRPLILTSNITIQGTDQTVLRLPPPAIIGEAAPMGQDHVQVADTSTFRAGTKVELALGPKKGTPEAEKQYPYLEIREVGPKKIVFTTPLPCDVPQGSRIGYRHSIFEIRSPYPAKKPPAQPAGKAAPAETVGLKNICIQKLTLDGGRVRGLHMPGHVRRCAILGTGPYSYEKGPVGPPLEGLQVLDCRIRHCYGRAVALYSVVRSKIARCQVEDIGDESIDLDHYTFHCEVLDNHIRHGDTGVTINDGSYCRVAGNHIDDCPIGITIWWWYQCPPGDIDVENVVQGNIVRGATKVGISVGKCCFRNQVIENRVQGPIKVVESDNVVRDNIEEN